MFLQLLIKMICSSEGAPKCQVHLILLVSLIPPRPSYQDTWQRRSCFKASKIEKMINFANILWHDEFPCHLILMRVCNFDSIHRRIFQKVMVRHNDHQTICIIFRRIVQFSSNSLKFVLSISLISSVFSTFLGKPGSSSSIETQPAYSPETASGEVSDLPAFIALSNMWQLNSRLFETFIEIEIQGWYEI